MQKPQKNKHDIRLTLIGTGTIRSKDSRAATAVLIESPESMILVDCGPGSWLRMQELKKDLDKIEHIFLTHFHPDHVLDLISILFYRYLNTAGQSRPIHIWGAKGLKRFFELLIETFGEWLENNIFKLNELRESSYKISDFCLKWLPAYHAKESICYRFERDKKVISISGDSGFCQELIQISRDADIAVFECSYPDDHAEEHHLTPERVGHIARAARVKRIILTHLYPEALESDTEHQISQKYSGSIEFARDGDSVIL